MTRKIVLPSGVVISLLLALPFELVQLRLVLRAEMTDMGVGVLSYTSAMRLLMHL